MTKDLDQIAYKTDLSPEQAEERASQLSDNALRQVDEQRRLEKNAEALLGLEQSFIEEVDSLIAAGRFVSPDDLAQMIKLYVEQNSLGGGLAPVSRKPEHHRLRLNSDARAVVLSNATALNRNDRSHR